jgi:predicted amidophosphoribosyltransferase
MFRCTNELKGLAIDTDSFSDIPIGEWNRINERIKCVFITSDAGTEKSLVAAFGNEKVLYIPPFQMNLSPNRTTHKKVVNILKSANFDIAYVSGNYNFIKNARSFLSGSIWVKQLVDYKNTNILPDLIVTDFEELLKALNANVYGFGGEIAIFPNSFRKGIVMFVEFNVDNDFIQMVFAGRYFPSYHYMAQLHPYSRAISLNKQTDKPYTGLFNEKFAGIYKNIINFLKEKTTIDGVCSVPVKPNKVDNFKYIIDKISKDCKTENYNDKFICIKDYEEQKALSSGERAENIIGVFQYNGDLTGKTVVVIDDIVTTGATLRECVRTLKKSGAKEVIAVVLAINQIGPTYWRATPLISCPYCGCEMILRVAGKGQNRGQFFYSCLNCFHNYGRDSTKNFKAAWKELSDNEDSKVEQIAIDENQIEENWIGNR